MSTRHRIGRFALSAALRCALVASIVLLWSAGDIARAESPEAAEGSNGIAGPAAVPEAPAPQPGALPPQKPPHPNTAAYPKCERCLKADPATLEWPEEGYDSFEAFIEGEVARVEALDIYGASGQLPEGYLGFKYQLSLITASQRYDSKGKLGPVLTPIEFELNGQKQLSIDLGLEGYGGGHNFMLSYGITNQLDWYIELPFTYMNLKIKPKAAELDDEGNRIGEAAASLLGVRDRKNYGPGDFLYGTLPALGRPPVATGYKAAWMVGDINTGFSWNFYRNPIFSAAMVGRVVLPTGHLPDPNIDLVYGTGPALEVGLGGWATSASLIYDVRLVNYKPWYLSVVASMEFLLGWGFEQTRPYPTNFTKPNPAAANLDPNSFPDLSGLEGDFSYTPGFNLGWTSQLNIGIGPFGLGGGFGVAYSQEPVLDADPAFETMVKGLELLGDSQSTLAQVGASVNLLPIYVPVSVAVAYNFVIGGRNTIVFDDYWQVTVQTVAPLIALWK